MLCLLAFSASLACHCQHMRSFPQSLLCDNTYEAVERLCFLYQRFQVLYHCYIFLIIIRPGVIMVVMCIDFYCSSELYY